MTLRLRDARTHSLHGIDLELDHGTWTAIVGPSGSGKSSLVVDTLVREGQHRFFASLDARARQRLGGVGRAHLGSLTGLPVPVVIGQRALTPSARSTVGTASGVLDLLRLWFAREAQIPDGVRLTRSHLSFNHPVGACPECQGLGTRDVIDPDLLVADESRSIRGGALVPTQPSGYTVYSQVTVEVLDQVCRAHGFDVDTPWRQLTPEQRDVVLYGSRAIKVPFGKHSLESRMKWSGITARPRKEGFYKGLIPVMQGILDKGPNPGVGRFVRTRPCPECRGTRLARPGREARLGRTTLPELLALPVRDLDLQVLPDSPVARALRPTLSRRLALFRELGLAHLSLARSSRSLSGGEGQRLRLVRQLTGELSGLLVALDEPTLGLPAESQPGLFSALEALREQGNTLVVVEHDPDFVRHAQRVITLGPGGGSQGGRVVHDRTDEADPLGGPPATKARPREPSGWLRLTGATLHTLAGDALEVPLGTLCVVHGPSGAGKSSLVLSTLVPALQGRPAGPYTAVSGADGLDVHVVDATPIGRTPRSTPATWTGLFDRVRKRFARLPEARARGWSASRFSYNTKAGRCPQCEGLGVERFTLHLFAPVERPCSVCHGARYAASPLEGRLDGRSIADVLDLTAAQARQVFAGDAELEPVCAALDDLGLGYLRLGQSSSSLSRGEAQRVKLATLLAAGRTARDPALLVLDEPDRGLHPHDVERLITALDAAVDAGHSVLAISHHRHLHAAADHRVEVREGRLRVDVPLPSGRLTSLRPRPPAPMPTHIRLEGVRTHHLDLDVDLPHGALVVVTGPSGSGKSSLVFDTLAAEAWGRFAESLPFEVRRFARRQARPVLDHAEGLTPTLALAQHTGRAGARSTVATQTGLGPILRVLFSRAGRLHGEPHDLSAEHFRADRPLGACPTCRGRGHVERASEARLVTHPDRSLPDGALDGTRPGRFFTEPDGQHMASLRAASGDDLQRPWRELPAAVRQVALHGAGERRISVSWQFERGGRTQEHRFEGTWPGLLALVEAEADKRSARKDAAAWRVPLAPEPCPACEGARLIAPQREVRVGGHALHTLLAMPASDVRQALATLEEPGREAVVDALRPELLAPLDDLIALGLGHLSLDRSTPTLSDGELQRVRLAGLLISGLSRITLALDEPAAGLHPDEVEGLVARLRALIDRGVSIVATSHRPGLIRAADHVVELGPGAGTEGGTLIYAGPPRSLAPVPHVPMPAPADQDGICIRGAHAHHLRGFDLTLPASGFVAVVGPSGSGKSSLVSAVLGASFEAGATVGCDSIDGLDRFDAVHDGRPRGETPLTMLGLDRVLKKHFGKHFGRAGRCPDCKGTGVEKVRMDALADLELPCPTCEGRRFRPEALAITWHGLSLHDLLATPVDDLQHRIDHDRLRAATQAMIRVGLGHLDLGRARRTLSGGELPRLGLAAGLLAPGRVLHLLDEPGRGLSEAELPALLTTLAELAAQDHLVVAAVHRESLVRSAQRVVRLGPGAGSAGGTLMTAGVAHRR